MANPQTFSGRPLISLALNHSVSGATVNWSVTIYETSSQPSYSGFPADNLYSYNFSGGGGPSVSNVQFTYDFRAAGNQTITLASGSFTATASYFVATASVASASLIGNASVDQAIYPSIPPPPPPAPAFGDNSVVSSASVGVVYNDEVTATNSPTYSVVAAPNNLPPGLTLNTSTGAITGTPTTPGAYSFVIRASNAGGSVDTPTLTITVTSAAKVWNGTAFVSGLANVWNGTAFVSGTIRVWNGSAWVNTN